MQQTRLLIGKRIEDLKMKGNHVTNSKAIHETLRNNQYAIFITMRDYRYAVKEVSPNIYQCFAEVRGGWERCEQLSNFLVWNGEFQGYDDITSIIIE